MTTEAQRKLLQLLSEIDEICQREELKYWLTNESALSAYRDGSFTSETTVLDIAMFLPDALKLREFILERKAPYRVMDSLYDNDNFPYFIFHYCDTTTTNINLAQCRGFLTQSLCVKVKILRKRPRKPLHYLESFFEKGWIYNHPNYSRSSEFTGVRLVTKKVAAVLLKLSRKAYKTVMIKLFELSQRKVSANNYLRLTTFTGKSTGFKGGTFSGQRLVFLDSVPCFVPSKASQYFSTLYGNKWRSHKFDTQETRETAITDAEIGYRDFCYLLDEYGIVIPDPSDYNGEAIARRYAKPFNKTIDGAWQIVLRSGARYKLWEQYEPLKDQIIDLRERGDWNELADLLSNYDKVARRFHSDHLGVSFDPELFDVYCDYLIRAGNRSLAQVLASEIPEPHALHGVADELCSRAQ